MANEYKSMAIERAKHLSEFLSFTVDHEVLVCADGTIDNMAVKFMDTYGNASPLYVSGSTWKDLYNSLCAIEDAIEFIIVAPRED